MNPPLRIAMVCAALLGAMACGSAATPEDLVGRWTWSWMDDQGVTHHHVLEVEGSGDKIAARERFDDQEPIKVTDLKVVEDKVTFSTKRGERHSLYSGTLKDDEVINGMVEVSVEGQPQSFPWTAKKEEKKP